jgi:hypothetical protein
MSLWIYFYRYNKNKPKIKDSLVGEVKSAYAEPLTDEEATVSDI